MWSQPSGALISVVFSACSDVTDGEISRLRSALFPEYRIWEKLAGDLGGIPSYWRQVARLPHNHALSILVWPSLHLPTLL
jgi:hypothetical protein